MKRAALYKSIPNILSFIRLGLVPLFVWLFLSAKSLFWAGLVFALAGVTDVLDGRLARHWNVVSRLGRIIDPLADKLMQLSAFACLAAAAIIPVWVIAILLCKEGIQLCGGWLILRRYGDVPASNIFGKAASTLFYFVTISIIIFDMSAGLRNALLCGSLALSLLALLQYGGVARRYAAEHERKQMPEN